MQGLLEEAKTSFRLLPVKESLRQNLLHDHKVHLFILLTFVRHLLLQSHAYHGRFEVLEGTLRLLLPVQRLSVHLLVVASRPRLPVSLHQSLHFRVLEFQLRLAILTVLQQEGE